VGPFRRPNPGVNHYNSKRRRLWLECNPSSDKPETSSFNKLDSTRYTAIGGCPGSIFPNFPQARSISAGGRGERNFAFDVGGAFFSPSESVVPNLRKQWAARANAARARRRVLPCRNDSGRPFTSTSHSSVNMSQSPRPDLTGAVPSQVRESLRRNGSSRQRLTIDEERNEGSKTFETLTGASRYQECAFGAGKSLLGGESALSFASCQTADWVKFTCR
jgi:hypothetical protein